jgi:hypothetical protein
MTQQECTHAGDHDWEKVECHKYCTHSITAKEICESLSRQRVREMTRTELITMGREWLRHAPPARPGAPGLLGFRGPVGFVCTDCAGRILGRGCNMGQLASVPVWTQLEGQPEPIPCALHEVTTCHT